ncbi:pilin [Candidatus Gracilibacteria bacterium]|nr:pilin [Candidatus Gracilibacteria bacterium]MCF7856112.1 pilin [Candidatus Gracilibacteria bacterium]MCF7896531.1 pilin [Candidatus Gracilibacteria bacterium]
MPKKIIFTIRKIRNANPRLPRIYRKFREKTWRLAVVIFLAIFGIAGLFFFGGNFENNIKASLLSADANEILGSGFETEAGFSDSATNKTLDSKDGAFKKDGIGMINAMLYNIKDYFKYIVGSIAILYLIIAATQIVTAVESEGVEKGKKNLKWSIVALVSIFLIDVMVTAFFESGATPGESLFQIKDGVAIESETNLMSAIAVYFKANVRVIFEYLKTIAGAFAILFIFLAGAHMISAGGNEEKIEKEKKFLIHAITAFVTLLILDQMIFGFIYPDNELGQSDPICAEFMNFTTENALNLHIMESGDFIQLAKNYGIDESEAIARMEKCQTAAELGVAGSNQILGIVKFFESLIGGIAIFFIVYSGVAIISSMGNEELVTKHKKTLAWSLAGLVVIILSETLVNQFLFVVDPATGAATINAASGITTIAGVTNFIATLVGVFSVISIIIAGMIWVSNFGNTEIAEKSKKIILGAIVGVILSVSAYAIVNSVTTGNSEGMGGSGINVELSN